MKTDARVRYTKMRIREAFFNALEENPSAGITVKELCDTAGINRATFLCQRGRQKRAACAAPTERLRKPCVP